MSAVPRYRFKRLKAIDLKTSEITYSLRLTSAMEHDPGDVASLELFEEYLQHLRVKKEGRKL